MGMDVYGKKPTSDVGAYFRRNVWGWHPLAELVCALAPALAGKCRDWHTNEGFGLDAQDSTKLAAVLRAKLTDGTVAARVARRDARLAALPDETCRSCNGTGRRSDRGETCRNCNGTGKQRPSPAWYGVTVADVEAFASFVASSGGFEIH